MQRFVTLNMRFQGRGVIIKLEQRGALHIAYEDGSRARHQLDPAEAHHLFARFDAHQFNPSRRDEHVGAWSVGIGCGHELPVVERFDEATPPQTLKPFIDATLATLWRLEPAARKAPAAAAPDDDLSWAGLLLATVAFGGAHMVTYSLMTWRFAASFEGISSAGGLALWLAYLLTGVALARIRAVREGGRLQLYTAPILGMCIGLGWALLMRDQLLDGMPTYALLLAAFLGLYCGTPAQDEVEAMVA